MGLPPCHLLSRRSSTFVLCVALFSIFFVTTVRLHSDDVSQTDEVERPGPTNLSNAHHTSGYQAQKEPKRLQFRLSRRSINADKEGNQSQSNLYTAPTYSHGGRRGDWLVNFFLGTPPQPLKLILDTGSNLVWVNADHFDYSGSSTFSEPNCTVCCSFVGCVNPRRCQWPTDYGDVCSYNYSYTSGERTTGVFIFDTVTLPQLGGGQSDLLPLFVGHSHTAIGPMGADDVDGIMGLGMGRISFASQVAPQEGSVFYYCLVNSRSPPDVTGPLVFDFDIDGGDLSEYQFTPFVSNDGGQYPVRLVSISVGGQHLSVPNGTFDVQNDGSGGFLFDCGTTYTNLYEAAYNSLVQAVQAVVSYPTISVSDANGTHYLCYDVSDVSNPTFPEVSFTFDGGAIMNLAQENVFGVITPWDHILCLLMVHHRDSSSPIFGSMQQQNRQIVYDVPGQRIGWSHPVDCSSM